jgi:hypothetical protein
LVGLTKDALKRTVGKALLSYAELSTMVIQTEAILNDRPLTYACNDDTAPLPISPSQLIYGHRLTQLPDLLTSDELEDPSYGTRENLTRRQLYCHRLLNNFWSRFHSEYLASLRERHSNMTTNCKINLGDVVLIEGENLAPRSKWKLGVVVKIFASKDSIIRTVELKTTGGNFTRPVNKLYPLEVRCNDVKALYSSDDSKIEETVCNYERPKRKAALDALDRLRRIDNNIN